MLDASVSFPVLLPSAQTISSNSVEQEKTEQKVYSFYPFKNLGKLMLPEVTKYMLLVVTLEKQPWEATYHALWRPVRKINPGEYGRENCGAFC